MSTHDVSVKTYDASGEELPESLKVSIGAIAKALGKEEFATLLTDYMNTYCNEYDRGLKIGVILQNSHRTAQGSICRLLLGVLVGIGDTDYYDPRNEKAVEVGKKLKRMIDNGTLDFGHMI